MAYSSFKDIKEGMTVQWKYFEKIVFEECKEYNKYNNHSEEFEVIAMFETS